MLVSRSSENSPIKWLKCKMCTEKYTNLYHNNTIFPFSDSKHVLSAILCSVKGKHVLCRGAITLKSVNSGKIMRTKHYFAKLVITPYI